MWWFKRTSTEFFHFCFHDDQVKAKVGAWLSWVNSTSRWVVKITTVSRWGEEILKVDVFAIRMGASFFLVVGWIIHPPTRIPGSSNKTDYQKIPLLKMIKNVPGGDDCVLVWLLWLASLRWLALSVDRKNQLIGLIGSLCSCFVWNAFWEVCCGSSNISQVCGVWYENSLPCFLWLRYLSELFDQTVFYFLSYFCVRFFFVYLIHISIGRSHNFGQGVDLWPKGWVWIAMKCIFWACRSACIAVVKIFINCRDWRPGQTIFEGSFHPAILRHKKNSGSFGKVGVYSTYPQGCLHYVFIAVGIVCAIWSRCPLLSRNFRRHCNKRARAQIGTLERREQT